MLCLQFYEAKGLVALDSIECYSSPQFQDDTSSDETRINATVSALQIASQLARNSENYFGQLLATFTPPVLVSLLCSVTTVFRSSK